ncbi:MAG: DUF3099 domain-containing protein [Streptosporangiaceae bacterium]|jgi:DUF3099 family protein
MRIASRSRNQNVPLVTQARRSLSEDISYRQRRYLIMMSFRAVCFGLTVLLFLNHFGWLAAIPAVFAIFVPYVAVVFANGGREPDNVRGFMEYRPNLPERRIPPGQGGSGSARQGSQQGVGDPTTHA